MALAQNKAPLYVYNEETLNEIFFDLSAMDALSGLFYPYHVNFHQPILQKAFELDACFRCNSLLAVNRLRARVPKLPPERIFFLSDQRHERDGEAALRQGLRVAVRTDTQWDGYPPGQPISIPVPSGWKNLIVSKPFPGISGHRQSDSRQ